MLASLAPPRLVLLHVLGLFLVWAAGVVGRMERIVHRVVLVARRGLMCLAQRLVPQALLTKATLAVTVLVTLTTPLRVPVVAVALGKLAKTETLTVPVKVAMAGMV